MQDVGHTTMSPTSLKKLIKRRRLSNKAIMKHAGLAGDRGISWLNAPGPDDDTLEMLPTLLKFTPRQIDILVSLDVKFPERQPRSIDITQSADFIQIRDNLQMTSPTMQLYLTHICRLSHGIEAMNFQGIHFGENEDKLCDYSHAFLQNLAGNAFEVRIWCR